ncbi:MAG: glycosyltransferase [Gemmatimonadales bacterium]|nr:glycosyltransferase [Gemmatimonadales bacterium]
MLAPGPPAIRSPGFSARTLPPPLRPEARLGVLDVTKYFGTTSGGIKTYLQEKARYVGSRPDLRQVIVVPGPVDAIATEGGSRTYRLRGARIPMHPPYRFLFATRSFRCIVEHERPDIIEVGSPFAVPWLTAFANRRLGAPTVWFYHSHLPRLAIPFPERAGLFAATLSALLARYVRLLGERFPVVLCGSRFAERELAALGVMRTALVPLGVDLTLFTPDRRAAGPETRRRFGLPDGPLALFIGRLAAEKRLDVILDAWPEVERRSGTRLVVVGSGPYEASLRAHRYARRVFWVPYQETRTLVADLLAAIDFYVAPGPLETFGLSVLEALASGTPVLSVEAGGGGELVQGSSAGACYTDGAPDHAADAAVRLAGQDLPVLGARGRSYAETHHAWGDVLRRLFIVYEGIRAGYEPRTRP